MGGIGRWTTTSSKALKKKKKKGKKGKKKKKKERKKMASSALPPISPAPPQPPQPSQPLTPQQVIQRRMDPSLRRLHRYTKPDYKGNKSSSSEQISGLVPSATFFQSIFDSDQHTTLLDAVTFKRFLLASQAERYFEFQN
jgi:hypothetical protein